MTCPHRTIDLAENGIHYCRECRAPVAVLDDRAKVYLQSIDRLVYVARRFAAVTRRRRKDLYKQAFNSLHVAARDLDEWYDEPVLPESRQRSVSTQRGVSTRTSSSRSTSPLCKVAA